MREVSPLRLEQLEGRVLMAADPISTDHPLWAVPRGSAVIDGELDEAAWAGAFRTTRSLAFTSGVGATVYVMYDSQGMYLGVEAYDRHLWADGNGSGTGDLWQIEQDDSITWYFDGDGSRELNMQEGDRAFGYNIANFTDEKNPSDGGPARRFKFNNGDGAGNASGMGWFEEWGPGLDPDDYYLPLGASYASAYDGTINDDSDIDVGWSSELFLPWSALNMSAPSHGQTMGMNFDLILDDTGGLRDLNSNRRSADKFEGDVVPDDHMVGVHSSYSASQGGIRGPISYAEVMFIDSRAGASPATVTDLSVARTSGYGTSLEFTAPAGTAGGLGHVSRYEIRYSRSPIGSARAWENATVFENRFTPRLAGKAESLRLIGLQPSTQYYVALRGVDAAGNLGAMATVSFTTQSSAQDGTGGDRLVVSPMGRSLVREGGSPFMVIGDHLGVSWAHTRQLFPGEVWDNTNEVFRNFSEGETIEGPYAPYFDSLQAHGINTMRVYLELTATHSEGNPALPGSARGTYWIEHTPGEYNDDMRAFLEGLMAEADARGMYLLISPYATYFWDDSFGTEGPWSTNFGGPLTDINEFFQTSGTLQMAKNRFTEVASWVQESEYAHRVMGYEALSEWNAYGWTLNSEGDATADRADEFRRRAVWVNALGDHMKAVDPDRIVFNSAVIEDPRGPIARSMFQSRSFDALTPHFYTMASEEPINNPSSDRAVMPAVEQATLTEHWLNLTTDRRPVLNGEWGPTREVWPGGTPYYTDRTYATAMPSTGGKTFTQAEDDALFTSVLWSAIASGQFGTPLRMPSFALNYVTGMHESGFPTTQGFLLSDAMRDTQSVVAAFFVNSALGFDWGSFSPDPLTGRLTVSSGTPGELVAGGSADGSQGMVYVLHDSSASTSPVSGASVRIDGLESDTVYDIEIWSTEAGTLSPMRTLSGRFSSDGTLVVALPDFDGGVVVRFRGREVSGSAESIVSVRAGRKSVTFTRGLDGQPLASIVDGWTGEVEMVDVAGETNFAGRVVDMTPYVTPDGVVHLAVTDENHHLWVFHGNLTTGGWTVIDLTAKIDAPGMTGDLTSYQPSWGAIHIGGLDARGHAINYWWSPGLSDWQYTDLTTLFDGETMAGGLAGFVSGWDGLNLAGLNEAGEVIVYWWAPGLPRWQTLNMTEQFDGPTLTGQLSAFITPWGGMNITGLNEAGENLAYWWAPGMGRWQVANLTNASSAPTFAEGVTGTVSTDGGINIFGLDGDDHLVMIRFSLSTRAWTSTDLTSASGAGTAEFPAGASSAGNLLVVGARERGNSLSLLLHTFDLTDEVWSWEVGQDRAVA